MHWLFAGGKVAEFDRVEWRAIAYFPCDTPPFSKNVVGMLRALVPVTAAAAL
jgi:hypothetical protein